MAVEARTGDSPRRAEPALVWSAALIRPQGQPRADCAALEQPITRNLPHLCPSRRRLAALNGPSGEYSGRSRVRLERRATDRTLSRARRAQVCILLLGGSRRASRRSLVVRASTWHGRRRVAAPRPASHANACALPGPRHSFARGGEDTSRSGSVLRAYCILDAELSDVIVFAAPRSTPAAARARAPPLLRSNTLNFMALQIRVGA